MDLLSDLWSKNLSLKACKDSYFDCIPNEILSKILQYLDLKSRLSAEKVCRRWRSTIQLSLALKTTLVIDDERRWTHICGDYKPYGLTYNKRTESVLLDNFFCVGIYDLYTNYKYTTYLSGIMSKYANLKKLYICLMVCPLKRNLLNLIAKSLDSPLLSHLSVISDDAEVIITRLEVQKLGQKFRNLKTFQLEAFSVFVKEKTIEAMLKTWPNIEVFILMSLLSNSEHKPDRETYTGSAFKCLNTKIKVLRVPGFVFTADAIQQFGQKEPNQLTQLDIFDLTLPNAMAYIGDHYTSVTRMYCSLFVGLESVTDSLAFFGNVAKLVHLKKLHLLIDSEFHVTNFEAIKCLKTLKKLQTLRIESTPMAVDAIEAMAIYLPHLTRLELSYVRIDPQSSNYVQWIVKMPNLTKIIISELNDTSFSQLVKELAQLSVINVSRCDNLTIESVKTVINIAKERPNRTLQCVFRSELFKPLLLNHNPIPDNLKVEFIYIRNC